MRSWLCSLNFWSLVRPRACLRSVRLQPCSVSCWQTKGYAEGAGDSLAGGLKKNVAKVTGNDAKEAEGK